MARRNEGSLFIGRLNKNARVKDLEDIFESYGRMTRCEVKYGGADMAFGFVDFEDRRDAEDAMRYENGRSVCGTNIIVEWAKGTPRSAGAGPMGRESSTDCFKCGRSGHIARDCTNDARSSYRAPDRFRERSRSRDRSGRRSRSR